MRNRSRLALALTVVFSALSDVAPGQSVTVEGVIRQRGISTSIAGATVDVSGVGSTTTDANGRFRVRDVPAGQHTVVARAIGFQVMILRVMIAVDTTLQIELDRLPVQLDTTRILGGAITISGGIRDSATHSRLLQAAVTVYPSGETVGALSGTFRIGGVPPGEITLVIEGFHHRPRTLTFFATKDTSLTIDLPIDSIARRMTAQQVKRLAVRANAIPISQQALTHDDMTLSGARSVYELIQRRFSRGVLPVNPTKPASETCIFYDDRRVEAAVLLDLPMEAIERIEIYGSRAEMIRVYSTQYVASLMRERLLPRVLYMKSGLRTTCG